VVLRPTRHKIGHSGDVSPSQSLGLVCKKLNLTQQKHAFTNQKKCTTTEKKINTKKLKPGLVAFYDIRRGNKAGLFSKEKISKGGDEYGKGEEKRARGEEYDINKQTIYIYIYMLCVEIENRIKGALHPGAHTGQELVGLTPSRATAV